MASILELLGLISYILVMVLVLVVVMIRVSAENRKVLISIASIFALIIINVFLYIPLIQFLLFILVILNIYYLIFVHILPQFYARRDRILFTEITKEVWEELKVNETITEEK